MKYLLVALCAMIALSDIASAIVIRSVTIEPMAPGEEASLEIEIENIFNEDVQDLVLMLDFKGTPFTPVGSSSDGFDKLNEGDVGHFKFRIRAAPTIVAGDYQLPYTLVFTHKNQSKTREGTIGIKVMAQPSLTFSIETETPVVGMKGKISLKIVNKGFAEARFVSVTLIPSAGFAPLSEKEVYIGTINSDDFETTNYNVLFTKQNPTLSAIVEYTDFENKKITKNINLPVTVYSREKALELGIIKRNNIPIYISIAAVIIVIWLVWRAIRKRQRMKRSLER